MGGKLERWSARNPTDKRRALLIGAGVATVAVMGTIAYVVITAPSRRTSKAKAKAKPKDCPAGPGTFRGIQFDELVTGGADPNDTLPMVVAFHGRGAAPRYMRPLIEKLDEPARVIIPRGTEPLGKNWMWWKTRSKGDQAELTENMTRGAAQLGPWVRDIARCRPTKGRPIVAGHSQGGMMSLGIAATQPERIHAAVAGSAWLPKGMWRSDMAPAHLVHGEDDDVVDFERTVDMVEDVTAKGNDWELEIIEDHGHNLSGPLLSEWLEMVAQTVRELG